MKLWPSSLGGHSRLAVVASNAVGFCVFVGGGLIGKAEASCDWQQAQHAGSRLTYPSCISWIYKLSGLIHDLSKGEATICLYLLVIAITVSAIRAVRSLYLRVAAAG